jgi:hypothetical protein
MSLRYKERSITEGGECESRYTVVAYKPSSTSGFRGEIDTVFKSDIHCVEVNTKDELLKALVELELQNLRRERGQKEWQVRIYLGYDLTNGVRVEGYVDDLPPSDLAPEDIDHLIGNAEQIAFTTFDEEQQRKAAQYKALMAKAQAETEAKERAELDRLLKKYGEGGAS